MAKATQQYVDPAVSHAKFAREIADYLAFEADYRARGWLLVKAEWPVVVVVLASNKTSPPTIVTAVRFDYSNYDAEPPSVRLIDPFSGTNPFEQGDPDPSPSPDARTGVAHSRA